MLLSVLEANRYFSKQDFGGYIYLYGEQYYLIEKLIDKILQKKKISLSDVIIYDSEKLDLDKLSDELVTVSFFGTKIVWIQHFLPETAKKQTKERLKELVPYLSQDNILIVTEEYREEGYNNKRASAADYRKWADQLGICVNASRPSKTDAAKYLEKMATAKKIDIDRSLLMYLYERCGMDFLQANTDLEKIAAYCMGRAVTRQDIDKLVAPTTETTAFEMSDALLNGNAARALLYLEDLFAQNEDPKKILGALSTAFGDIYKFKVGEYQALSVEETEKMFGYKHGNFRVTKALRACKKLSLDQCRRLVCALAQCDSQLKGNNKDEKLIMQTCLVALELILLEKG